MIIRLISVLSVLLAVSPMAYSETSAKKYVPGPYDNISLSGISNFRAGENLLNLPNSKSGEDENFIYYESNFTRYRQYKVTRPLLAPDSSVVLSTTPGFLWAGNFEIFSDDVAPAKPDCSERPFGIEDYMAIVNDNQVMTRDDFLKRIPKDSLQKFTFIYKSKSLQRSGVDEMHPRVMRFSTDGRFVLTYTCAETADSKDTIEALYFDNKTRKYNLVHTTLPPIGTESFLGETSKNTVFNHKACLACHGGSDPRPNWDPYDEWRGVYGSRDDQMWSFRDGNFWIHSYGDNAKMVKVDGTSQVDIESQNYVKMRQDLADNPCISTLPWPDKSSPNYWNYPYIPTSKMMNYHYRPNAHFTIASSRVNAQRIARKLESHPIWPYVRWEILSKTLNCESSAKNSPLLQKLIYKENGERRYSPESYYDSDRSVNSELLYSVGLAFGFYQTDWHMKFNPGGPTEGFANYHTAQWPMSDFVLSVLYSDLAKEDTSLAFYDIRYNRMSNLFGKQFMCVDETADKLWLTQDSKTAICKILESKIAEEQRSQSTVDLGAIRAYLVRETREGQERPSVIFPSAAKGRAVAQNLCAQCHDGKILFSNFKNEDALKKIVRVFGEKYSDLIKDKTLETNGHCEMPLSMAGPCLSETERNALIQYIESLRHATPTNAQEKQDKPKTKR